MLKATFGPLPASITSKTQKIYLHISRMMLFKKMVKTMANTKREIKFLIQIFKNILLALWV
jgi:hypothetical protein